MSVESYKTKKGVRWRVRYTVDGKRTDKRGFALKRDAQAWEAAHLLHPQSSSLYHGTARTVNQLYVAAVERNRRAWKPSWERTVDSKWRTHVQPEFGRLPARAITRERVEQWVNRLVKKYAPATIRDTVGVLRTCLRVAVDDHEIDENPTDGVRLPKVSKRRERRVYLTVGQLLDLARAARETARTAHDRVTHPAIILLLGFCGLRWGEMCGLQPRDIDQTRHRISVSRDCVHSDNWHVGTPKNGKPRSVPLPHVVEEAVLPLMDGLEADDWLFTSAGGKHPHYQTYLPGDPRHGNWWTRAVDAAGVPHVTPHDLRHTAASIAVSLGGSVLVVQRMLGHSSAAMTLDVYADLFDSDLDDVRGRMDSAVDEIMQE